MRPKTNSTNYHNLLFLLIPTFLLIVAWIGFTIYGNRVQSTISEVQNKRITPISPTFDLATIASLKSREQVSPIFTFQAPPPEEPFTTPTASESAIPQESEQQLTNDLPLTSSESAVQEIPRTGGTP